MAEFRRMIVTDKGRNLIAKMIEGALGIQFTHLALSETMYSDSDIPALTHVSGVKQTTLVTRTLKLTTAAVKLEGAVNNENLSTGYTLNSIAVYATDPDEGEILYSVASASTPSYVPPYNGVTVSGIYLTVTTTVSNADHVNLTVDPAATATIGDILELEKRLNDLEADRRNPNLLDNWYFADPINQRGETEYTAGGGGYAIDRWRLNGNGEERLEIIPGSHVKLTSTAIYGAYMDQQIDPEIVPALRGQEVTLSAFFQKNNGFSLSIYINDEWKHGSAQEDFVSFTYTIPMDANKIHVSFGASSENAEPSSLVAVKLELGRHQTLAYQDSEGHWVLHDPPPNKALETLKCQRYFQRLSGESSWGVVGIMYADGTGKGTAVIPLVSPMRTHPSLIFTGLYAGKTKIMTLSKDQWGPNFLKLYVTTETQLPEGVYLITQGGSGVVDVSADL